MYPVSLIGKLIMSICRQLLMRRRQVRNMLLVEKFRSRGWNFEMDPDVVLHRSSLFLEALSLLLFSWRMLTYAKEI